MVPSVLLPISLPVSKINDVSLAKDLKYIYF